jgi:hypothetical protein
MTGNSRAAAASGDILSSRGPFLRLYKKRKKKKKGKKQPGLVEEEEEAECHRD